MGGPDAQELRLPSELTLARTAGSPPESPGQFLQQLEIAPRGGSKPSVQVIKVSPVIEQIIL